MATQIFHFRVYPILYNPTLIFVLESVLSNLSMGPYTLGIYINTCVCITSYIIGYKVRKCAAYSVQSCVLFCLAVDAVVDAVSSALCDLLTRGLVFFSCMTRGFGSRWIGEMRDK